MAKKYKNFYGEEENEIEAFIENASELKEVKHETPISLIKEEYKDEEKIVFSEMVYEENDDTIDEFNSIVDLKNSALAKLEKLGFTNAEISFIFGITQEVKKIKNNNGKSNKNEKGNNPLAK